MIVRIVLISMDGETPRWVGPGEEGSLDFTVDEVLALKKNGRIRIGLDIGGGAGTLAVRMKEMGDTIVSTTMNLIGPFAVSSQQYLGVTETAIR